jgi:hypothetical protein
MSRRKEVVVLVISTTAAEILAGRQVMQGLRQAASGWRQDPAKMAGKIGASFVVGQMIFWLIGSDQIGFFMDPKKRFGIGLRIGRAVNRRLPQTAIAAWTVKVIEVLTDAARMPIEGALYRRHGIVPDAVAAAVTQPAWTAFEVAEKVSGVVLHPERINTPFQVEQSLANIYGSLFRYAQSAVLWYAGQAVNRHLSQRIANRLTAVGNKF